MNTTPKTTSRTHQLLIQLKCFFVSLLVPRYLRRAILMCSLAALITRVDERDHAALAKNVCDDLDIAYVDNPLSMLFPMHFGAMIWGEVPQFDLRTSSRGSALTNTAQRIYDLIPQSLRYATSRAMHDDILTTIRSAAKTEPTMRIAGA